MANKIGFIYKISSPGDECYIGSTSAGVSDRMVQHRNHWDTWYRSENKKGRCSSFDLFDKYGWDQCSISVLEVVEYDNRAELGKAERKWLDQTSTAVNKNRPAMTREEHLAKMKEWRAKNKEYFKNYVTQPVECECGMYVQMSALTNHRKLAVHARRIKENTLKEKIETGAKKPYTPVEDSILCGCGQTIKRRSFSDHRKTAVHTIWVQAELSKSLLSSE